MEIVLLLTGTRATAVRKKIVGVFVRYVGGDESLAEEVLRNRQVQECLARETPDHPARAFGERVEAMASSAGRAHVQQDLVQKTCEMVFPAVTRALAEAFSQKIDDMVQQWQRQAMQQVDATLQDSIKL